VGSKASSKEFAGPHPHSEFAVTSSAPAYLASEGASDIDPILGFPRTQELVDAGIIRSIFPSRAFSTFTIAPTRSLLSAHPSASPTRTATCIDL